MAYMYAGNDLAVDWFAYTLPYVANAVGAMLG